MTEHTPTPWMTQPCGELLPNDVMIIADCGKNSDGIQAISTVARALSIRQTPEVTAANAAFIVTAVNCHEMLVKTLEGIAEFSSGDDATLGALSRLASIRNTALNVLAHVSTLPNPGEAK